MRDKLIPFIVGLAGLFCSGALFIVLQFCIRTARRQREKAVLTSAAETAAAREQARVGSSGNGVISPLLPVRPRSSNFLYNWATVRHGRMRNRRALEEELNEEEEDDDVETRSLRQRRKERVQQYPMYDYSKKRRESWAAAMPKFSTARADAVSIYTASSTETHRRMGTRKGDCRGSHEAQRRG